MKNIWNCWLVYYIHWENLICQWFLIFAATICSEYIDQMFILGEKVFQIALAALQQTKKWVFS